MAHIRDILGKAPLWYSWHTHGGRPEPLTASSCSGSRLAEAGVACITRKATNVADMERRV